MYRKVLVVSVATLALGVAGIPTAAGHSAGSQRTHVIEAQDDCEPLSFNLALNDPTACVGDGETTFDEAIEELIEDKELKDWTFDPDEIKVRNGDSIEVRGEGGEFHTFTKVTKFGGGCVEQINELLKLDPVEECKDLVTPPGAPPSVLVPRGFVEDGVPPGGKLIVPVLNKGTQKYECLIHPWMHAEVKVRHS